MTMEDDPDVTTDDTGDDLSGTASADAYVDTATSEGSAALANALRPCLDAVLDAIAKAKTPQDVKRLMPDLPSIDTEEIARVAHEALVLGHLAGRASVHEDHDPEDHT